MSQSLTSNESTLYNEFSKLAILKQFQNHFFPSAHFNETIWSISLFNA